MTKFLIACLAVLNTATAQAQTTFTCKAHCVLSYYGLDPDIELIREFQVQEGVGETRQAAFADLKANCRERGGNNLFKEYTKVAVTRSSPLPTEVPLPKFTAGYSFLKDDSLVLATYKNSCQEVHESLRTIEEDEDATY